MTTSVRDERAAEIDMAWAIHRPVQPPNRSEARRIRATLSEQQNHRCCWCGVRMADEHGDTQATIEHLLPLSLGGTNVEDNLAVACRRCNEDRAACDHCPGALAALRGIPKAAQMLARKLARMRNRMSQGRSA
jgi:5-methylcytosine-specific restriction endonuclease McrA